MSINVEDYNPLKEVGGHFRSGQAEAITSMVNNFEKGIIEQTLKAPTAAGKTLDLVAFGNILKEEFGVTKILFTSPQVALIETGNLFGLPKLVGKTNYPCPGLQGCTAEDCLFPGNTPKLWSACDYCPYNKAKAAFRAVDFGATTFARYLVDPMIRRETAALLIDESSNLFDSLIDSSSIEIPEKVFEASQESSLHEALHAWWSQLLKDIAAKESRLKLLRADLKDMKSPDKKLLDEAKKVQKECSSLIRKADAANKAMGYIKKEVPYIVTSEEEFRYIKGKRGQKVKTLVHTFRLLDVKIPYCELVTGLQCVILASGTPTTSLLTTDPKHAYVTIQHPIDPGRRTVTYKPIGSMNYTERYNTAPKMAQEIIQLHNQYHRNTLVHCGNYEIAKLLMDRIDGKASVLLQNRNERKDNFNSWFKGDDTIFLSVNFEQGMDCKGEKFPMNIIAKVPFPNLGSQWVKARNNLDSWQWYNMQTALMVMQACGRTTRTPQDYSETYILDASWKGFIGRNKSLFFDWFLAALR